MKKNKYSIQSVLSICFACLIVFAGCAGFTEDGNSLETNNSIDINLESQFAAARTTQIGKVDVGETESTITIIHEQIGACVKKDSVFKWDESFYWGDTIKYYCSFKGDTLVLTDSSINHDTGLPTYRSLFFIGGTNGVLDGIWMLSPCVSYQGDLVCWDHGVTTFIQIDGDKIEFRESQDNFDYMSSGFVYNLFSFIDRKPRIDYSVLSQADIFAHSMDLEYWTTQDNFVINNKTNRNMTFTYEGRSWTLNVDYVSRSDSAVVSLSSGDATCQWHFREKKSSFQELCREEFEEYLYSTYWYSFDTYVWNYKNNNYEEFGSCINRIQGIEKK